MVGPAVYARVLSAGQKSDLDRQVSRVTAWTTTQQIPIDKVVTGVGSALNGHWGKFVALLRDPAVTRMVVEHRDRFCRLGTPRRHLSYKTGWHGAELVVANRWFPSSKTCHLCGHVQDIGWAEYWQCDACQAPPHQRDDNAAINLARYEDTDTESGSVVGPVGAAVKRGADRKTRPSRASGREARKGRSRTAAEQPRDGVQVA